VVTRSDVVFIRRDNLQRTLHNAGRLPAVICLSVETACAQPQVVCLLRQLPAS